MFIFGGLRIQGSRRCLSHDFGSSGSKRERLMAYVCTLHYSVLRYCKVVEGFRVRLGYLCGTFSVHENRY
jgi:hypothetical protein